MMENQHSFLTKIRTELGKTDSTARFSDHFSRFEFPHKRAERTIPVFSPREKAEQVEIFAANCEPLNTRLHRASSFEQAAQIVMEMIRKSRVEFGHDRHIMQHDHPDVAALELWKRFPQEAVTLHTSFAGDCHLRQKTIASFIGITAPDLAVAESGTLLEIASPGRPRSTSLVPSIHIALLPVNRIVTTLEQAYIFLQEGVVPDSFVFISGPSKTADIEAHLVHGAHGPCELHIIIIQEPHFI